jgi:hypothetical protein
LENLYQDTILAMDGYTYTVRPILVVTFVGHVEHSTRDKSH